MSYHSQFTGEQMDAVFRRVSNMIVGSVEIPMGTGGVGHALVTNIGEGMTDPKVFACVHMHNDYFNEVHCNVLMNTENHSL